MKCFEQGEQRRTRGTGRKRKQERKEGTRGTGGARQTRVTKKQKGAGVKENTG